MYIYIYIYFLMKLARGCAYDSMAWWHHRLCAPTCTPRIYQSNICWGCFGTHAPLWTQVKPVKSVCWRLYIFFNIFACTRL